MVNLDLDVLMEEKRTVRLFGKDIKFKDLTVEEHLANEALISKLDILNINDPKEFKNGMNIIKGYMKGVLEIDDEEASKVTMKQFKALRTFIGRLELYDQGFSDREIDKIEKEAAKKQIADLLK